jgi:hypothetical protein
MHFIRLTWLALLATSCTSTPTSDSHPPANPLQKRSNKVDEDIEQWANPMVLPIYIYRVYRGLYFQFNVYGMNEVNNTHGTWNMRSHFGPDAEFLHTQLVKRTTLTGWSFQNITDARASWRRGYDWEMHWNSPIGKPNTYWVETFAAMHAPFDWIGGTKPQMLRGLLNWPGPLIGPVYMEPNQPPFDECYHTEFGHYDKCKAHLARGCNMPWGQCRDVTNILRWVHPKFYGSCTTCPDPDLVQFKYGIETLKRNHNLREIEIDRLRGRHGMSDAELAKVGQGKRVPERPDLIVGGTRTLVDDLNDVLREYGMSEVVLANYGSLEY